MIQKHSEKRPTLEQAVKRPAQSRPRHEHWHLDFRRRTQGDAMKSTSVKVSGDNLKKCEAYRDAVGANGDAHRGCGNRLLVRARRATLLWKSSRRSRSNEREDDNRKVHGGSRTARRFGLDAREGISSTRERKTRRAVRRRRRVNNNDERNTERAQGTARAAAVAEVSHRAAAKQASRETRNACSPHESSEVGGIRLLRKETAMTDLEKLYSECLKGADTRVASTTLPTAR